MKGKSEQKKHKKAGKKRRTAPPFLLKTKQQLIARIKALQRKVERLEEKHALAHPASARKRTTTDPNLSILTELPEIVYKVNPDGKFAFINNAVQLLGHDPKDLIGKHFRTIVHPDDVKYFSRAYVLPKYKGTVTGEQHAPKLFDERRTGPRKTRDLEIRLISKDWKRGKKDPREFIGIVTAFGDVSSTGQYGPSGREKSKRFLGSLGIIRDVTERKHMENALRESEERYRDLVEKAGIAILIDDQEGRFKYFNARFATLFEYSHDEMKQQAITSLVHPDDVQRVMGYHTARMRGKPAPSQYEFKGVCKNGASIFLEVHVVELKDDNQCIGTRSYIWDITSRKKVEEHLRTQILHDELTGIHNRRGFTLLAQQQQKIAQRQDKGFLILFADIDSLKYINDTYGHHEGDQALKIVADVLSACFRASDIIARIGGDEFAVLAIESDRLSNTLLTERLHNKFIAYNNRKTYPFTLNISIGTVYCDPKCPLPIDDLLTQADKVMYAEKRKKRS
jgi:diguanylate cyclase (GGDEF)-like protein/PAS domain S-box-containing protein